MLRAGHLMGYLDQIVAVLAVAAIWCALRDRYWTAALVTTAAVLVHETMFFIGVPVLLMTTALRPDSPRGRALVAALAPLVLPVAAGAAIFVMRYPLLDYQVDRFSNGQRLLYYAPFVVCATAFVLLNRRRAADAEGT